MKVHYDKRLVAALSEALSLRSRGQLDQAERVAIGAVRAEPRFVEVHRFLAYLSVDRGEQETAVHRFKKALVLDPGHGETLRMLALLFHKKNGFEEALTLFARGRVLEGGSADLHLSRGKTQTSLERPAEAMRSYKRAVLLEPTFIDPLLGLSRLLKWTGLFEQAKRSLYQCWRIDPDRPDIYRTICQLHHKVVEPEFVRRLHALLEIPDLGAGNRRALNFAAADIARDRNDVAKMFHHLAQGHRARADDLKQTYDLSVDIDYIELCRTHFSKEFLLELQVRQTSDLSPIFIVGMPRSGTTLAEQILASHTRVRAAGELVAISVIFAKVFDVGRPDRTGAIIEALSADHLGHLATSYREFLRPTAAGAPYVTDKMPHNFKYLWLINALFPNAPIIHCVRNPVDTCVSIYQQDFEHWHAYADDLRSLGRHYRLFYREIMNLWSTVLPRPIFTLKYEDLVEDPESNVRDMLDYCGLPFESGCLSFENGGRMVRTSSDTQIRNGIYTTSRGRWRQYEAHIGPLLEELGDMAYEP
jgi:tetratricopeptide (TPR) repeat protein